MPGDLFLNLSNFSKFRFRYQEKPLAISFIRLKIDLESIGLPSKDILSGLDNELNKRHISVDQVLKVDS